MTAAPVLMMIGPREADVGWRDGLRCFRVLLLVHVFVRTFLNMPSLGDGTPVTLALCAGTLLAIVAGVVPRLRRRATVVTAVLVGLYAVWSLPFTANHIALEVILLALFAFLDENCTGAGQHAGRGAATGRDRSAGRGRDAGSTRPADPDDPAGQDEGTLLLSAVRWIAAVCLFYTGVQKLLWGTYFDGQFLAYMAGTEERFGAVFRLMMPAEEFARLQSYNEPGITVRSTGLAGWTPKLGAGPYRVASPLFVVMSNAVWLFETAAGVCLLLPRTRTFAALAGIVFVCMIEAGAREFTFGLLMVSLLLLFLSGPWLRRALPVLLACYGYLFLHRVVPGVPFIPWSPA